MSKLSLDLNVKTQQQLVEAFAKALESVASSSEQADNKTNNLSNAISKQTGKITSILFSFNQWTQAAGAVGGALKKITGYITEMSDKLHDNEIRVMRYQSRWGVDGFKDFTRIKERFTSMGLSADMAASALDTLSASQAKASQAEGLGIAAINTGKLIGLTDDQLKSFIGDFSKLIDMQGRWRPDQFGNLINSLAPVDADKLLKSMGSSLLKYQQLGIQAVPTWEKFSETIIKETSGVAKAVSAVDPQTQLNKMNAALDQFKLKVGEALLLPAPGESISALQKITDEIIKFVSNGDNIKKITDLFEEFSKTLKLINPILELIVKSLKWFNDNPGLAGILGSTITGAKVGGVPGAIVGAFTGTVTALTGTKAASEEAKQDFEAQKEAKEKTLKEIAKLQANLDQTNLRNQAMQMGKNWAEGFGDGINQGTDEVKKAVEELANAAEQTMRDKTETHSPSRVAARIGGDWSDGVGVGMTERSSQVVEAARNLSQNVITSTSNTLNNNNTSTSNTLNNNNTSTSNTSISPSLNITISGGNNSSSDQLVNTLNTWWETISARQAVSGL